MALLNQILSDPKPDPNTPDDALTVKLVFSASIFFISVFFGVLPAKWGAIRNSQTILSILNSFSAGVFIAIAFMHILPEAVETYDEICKESHAARCFPWPYFILFLGYSMILLLDKVAFDSHDLFDDGHGHKIDPAELKL
jgi:zinc transporter ZupT